MRVLLLSVVRAMLTIKKMPRVSSDVITAQRVIRMFCAWRFEGQHDLIVINTLKKV
jgi:hypothetical protein